VTDRGDALRKAFGFEPADLAANRAGRLSARQTAVLRAGHGAMRLSFAVFALVMLGSAALVAVMAGGERRPGTSQAVPAGTALAVALVVIALGWGLSRRYLAAAAGRRLDVARGRAEIVATDAASHDVRLRLGPTVLRFPSAAHLAPFQPGTEYRVYYLPGPMPLVLSAEAVDAESRAGAETPDGTAPEGPDPRLRTIRRGRIVLVLLGVLALGIPVVGMLARRAPAAWQPLLWPALLLLALGFAGFAVWWLSPRR
jgi:hypothetical protein